MSKDLDLRLRLTATDKNVAGTVRSTKKEVQGLNETLGATSQRARGTASGFSGLTTAGDEATRMFRLQKGSLQQAGFQFQDLAVQIGSGTSAFVAIGQQGSQLLGILGPGGALLGAIVAIGSVVGGIFASSMMDGANAAEALDKAMERLDSTIEESDGIPTLTKEIRDLARESEIAARARIVSAMQAAEQATKSAASSIRDSFDEIADTVGFSSLSDFFEGNPTIGRVTYGAIADLRDSLELTGDAGYQAARKIFIALRSVDADPAIENIRELERVIAEVSTGVGADSDALQPLVGRLAEFFDAARTAEERAKFLKSIIGDLGSVSGGEAAEKVGELVQKLEEQAETLGKNTLEMIRYNEAADIKTAIDNGATDAQLRAIRASYDQIYAYEQNAIATKEARQAQQEYEQSVVSLVNELDPLGAQFESVYEKQQLLIKAAANGDISEQYRDTLIANLVEGMADAGEEGGADFADKMEKQMSAAGERVASSLQSAITSGNWDGIGASIGGALAGAIGGMVTDALTEQMAGQALAGIAGPIAGAIAGGVAGLAVAKIGEWLSGDDWDPTESRQARQGTGTVLGDINAKSESIRRAVEASEDGIGQLVGINQGMLRALQTLELGIGGASAMVARERSGIEFGTTNRYSQAQLAGGGLGIGIGGITTGSFGPLFGLGSEIYGFLDDALGGILSDGMEFLDDLTGGLLSDIGSSVFGGDQKVVDEGIRILGGNINDMVNRTLVQAYASIREDGGWFGSDKRFDRFQDIATNQFSLAFESIYGAVEQSAAALGIDASRRLGDFTVSTQKISLEGLSAEEQQAELKAYFSTVFDDLAGAAVPFLEEFQRAGEGLGETLARVANETMVTEEAVRRLGLNLADLSGRELVRASERLVEATGGMEQFIGSMESFIDTFATDAQQFALASSDLSRALEQQGLAVPQSREAYWGLMQAQNAATESGAENIATLLRLQDVADEYYTALEDGATRAIQMQRDELASALDVAEQAANSVRSAIDGLNRSASEFSGTARAAAEDYLRGLVRRGSVEPGRALDDALSSVTDIRADQFTSFNDYITEVSSTGRLLADLDQITQAQVSVEQQMLDSLDHQAQLLEQGNADQLAALVQMQSSVDQNTQAMQLNAGSAGAVGVSGVSSVERSNGEVVQELRKMKEELLAFERSIDRHSERTARVLERIEREGLEVRQ